MHTPVILSEKKSERNLERAEAFLRDLPRHLKMGQLTVIFPDGGSQEFRGSMFGASATIRLNTVNLAKRLQTRGVLGFLEGYVAAEWDSPDLAKLLYLLRLNEASFTAAIGVPSLLHRAKQLLSLRAASPTIVEPNSDFYNKWLDSTLSTTAALFLNDGEAFEQAHRNKYQRALSQLTLTKDSHILEIGGGWGGFAEYAAQKIGCRITTVIPNATQRTFATARFKALKDPKKVIVRAEELHTLEALEALEALKALKGRFDHIVSFEILPLLGAKHWQSHFKQLKSMLKPQGKIVLQTPLIDDTFLEAHLKNNNFIRTYFAPKLAIPSLQALEKAAAASFLSVQDSFFFGQDYARTAREWQDRFHAAWLRLSGYNYTERTRRLWMLLFASMEACFLEGRLTVAQLTFTHATPQWQ
jgi:cyclopropane-fatty-acyl-phospholipid synthase